MQDRIDSFEKKMEEKLRKEAEEIERELQAHPELKGLKPDDDIKERIDRQIEEYNRGKFIGSLSEEDREALRLGREALARRDAEKHGRKTRKKAWLGKRFAAAAAVLVLAAGIGVGSVGGATRVVEIMKQFVGGREMTQIESGNEDRLNSGESKEEVAYQEIRDKLGIDPVKIEEALSGMAFSSCEVDEYLQTAYIIYDNKGKNISYLISTSFADESLGIDIEDELVNEYEYPLEEVVVQILEYKVAENKAEEYVARFEYLGVHYQLVAMVEKEEFEKILNRLHFP